VTDRSNGKHPTNGAANRKAEQARLAELPDSDQKLLRKCVLDLVALIQNPANLREIVTSEAFEVRLKKMGLDETKAKKRVSMLLTALPQTEALLERIDEKGRLFRWQYDVHGFAIASDASLQDAEKSVGSFRALEAQDAELRKSFGVGIELLEGRFSLMQASIKWPEAMKLARQLDAATGIGDAAQSMLSEAVALSGYCAAVAQAMPRFAQAITVCKLLAPKKLLAEALPCLTEGLELPLLPNEKRGDRIAATLSSILQSLSMKLPDDALKFALDSSTLERITAGAPVDWRPAYFSNWRARVLGRISSGNQAGEPNWADVAMLLARDGKTTLLNRAWAKNAASLWTEILIAALSRKQGPDGLKLLASDGLEYPAWAAPCAMALLGFPIAALSISHDYEASDLASVLGDRKDATERRIVVVVATEPSALEIPLWSTSQSHAAFVVSRSRLPTLASCLASLPARFTTRGTWLIVEGTETEGPLPPENLLDATLPKVWQDFWPPTRRVQVFAKEPPPKANVFSAAAAAAAQAFKSTPRYIVGARSIDDAVGKADNTEGVTLPP